MEPTLIAMEDLSPKFSELAFGGNNTAGPIDIATARSAHGGPHGRIDFASETFVVGTLSPGTHPGAYNGQDAYTGHLIPEIAASLTRGAESSGKGGYAGRRQEDDTNLVAHSLRAEGFDDSEDGSGRGTPIVVVHAFDTTQITSKSNYSVPKQGDSCHPLAAHAPAIAFSIMPMNSGKDYKAREVSVAQPLMAAGPVGGNQGGDVIASQWAVRRLTPTECSRLMGITDDGFLRITFRGKPAADGPIYKAVGNSQARNVMRWLAHGLAIIIPLT